MTEEERDAYIAVLGDKSFAELCNAYVRLRDGKKRAEEELARKLDGVKGCMDLIEGLLLNKLSEQNIDSVATPTGTCYRKMYSSYSVKDRDAYLTWAQTNDAVHALDIRASKAAVDEIVSETGEVPPGLNRSSIFKVGIRRSTNQ